MEEGERGEEGRGGRVLKRRNNLSGFLPRTSTTHLPPYRRPGLAFASALCWPEGGVGLGETAQVAARQDRESDLAVSCRQPQRRVATRSTGQHQGEQLVPCEQARQVREREREGDSELEGRGARETV